MYFWDSKSNAAINIFVLSNPIVQLGGIYLINYSVRWESGIYHWAWEWVWSLTGRQGQWTGCGCMYGGMSWVQQQEQSTRGECKGAACLHAWHGAFFVSVIYHRLLPWLSLISQIFRLDRWGWLLALCYVGAEWIDPEIMIGLYCACDCINTVDCLLSWCTSNNFNQSIKGHYHMMGPWLVVHLSEALFLHKFL